MTKPPDASDALPIVVQIGAVSDANLDACARVIARLAVEKALEELRLDFGPTSEDTAGNLHKSGPAGVTSTDRAKEQVT